MRNAFANARNVKTTRALACLPRLEIPLNSSALTQADHNRHGAPTNGAHDLCRVSQMRERRYIATAKCLLGGHPRNGLGCVCHGSTHTPRVNSRMELPHLA